MNEPAKRGASEPSNRPRPDTPSVAEVQSWSATGNRTPVDSDRRVPGWIGVAVIVAVDGPSAAGKSTWCRATSEQFVAEYTPTGEEPDGSDPAEQATYWAQVNAQRWTQALTLQAATGVAV